MFAPASQFRACPLLFLLWREKNSWPANPLAEQYRRASATSAARVPVELFLFLFSFGPLQIDRTVRAVCTKGKKRKDKRARTALELKALNRF